MILKVCFDFCVFFLLQVMTDLSITVEINSSSKECIFAGNLLKAPPLNRRGRKVGVSCSDTSSCWFGVQVLVGVAC